MFSEKPTYLPKPKFTYHFSFHFQIPEIRSPRSHFYKKRKKKERQKHSQRSSPTCPSLNSLTISVSTSKFQRSGVQEAVPTKKRKKKERYKRSQRSSPTCPNLNSLTISVFTSKFQRSGVQEAFSTKKKKERILEIFFLKKRLFF